MAALLAQFAAFTLTARGLGAAPFGIYAAVLSVAAIGTDLVGMGGMDLFIRAVSRDKARHGPSFGHMLLLIVLTLPVVILVATWVLSGPLQSPLPLPWLAFALAGEILIARIAASLEGMMVAHRDTVLAGWVRLATPTVRLIVAAVYFGWLSGTDLHGWILAVAVQAAILSAVWIALAWRRYGRPTWVIRRDELGLGMSFCVTQVARSAQSNMDRMALARFASEAALGVYSAGSRFLQIGTFPIQVASRIMHPEFYARGEKGLEPARQYGLRMAPVMFGVGLAGTAMVWVAAHAVTRFLGHGFDDTPRIAGLLGLALPFMGLQNPAGDVLSGSDRQPLRTRLSLVSTALFGLLMFAGASLRGVHGAIAAFVAGHALFAAVLWGAVWRESRRPEST